MKITTTYQPFFLSFFLILMCSGNVRANNKHPDEKLKTEVSTGAEFFMYNSFSQLRHKLPMKAGYPVYQTHTSGIYAGLARTGTKRTHELYISALIPSKISSDNGTGVNYLLNENGTIYSRSSLNYNLWLYIFRRDKFNVNYALSTGFLHEFRKLSYVSEVTETASDISLYFGPGIKASFIPISRLVLEGAFIPRVHIPWLNYGIKNKMYPEEINSFRSPYHSLIYETNFSMRAGYEIFKGYTISLGYVKKDMLGYGSALPTFNPKSVIHYKLDRIHSFLFQINFTL